MKLSIQSISKAYGGNDLFREFSLEVASGTRLAVIGPNGTGKSTLIKILAGVAEPDSGRVQVPSGARVGYVAQELDQGDLSKPLLTFVLDALPSWREFWHEWEEATQRNDTAALGRLAEKQHEFELAYGYNPEHKAHAVLSGLGFDITEHSNALASFSGGWRERAKLARVLVAGADILFLDEPTNHLDLEAVEWLEAFLLAYTGVLVFVAHDRLFIDRVGTHVLLLGGSKPQFRKGTFEEFLAWQAENEEQRRREAKRLSDEIEKKMDFVRRFKYKATKARQAGSKKKQAMKLEKELEGLNPERKRKTLEFKWPEPARTDKTVLAAADLTFGFSKDKALWKPLTFNLYRGQKIALAGPNGCGKSTLIKLAVGDLKPWSGNVEMGSKVRIGYYTQHQLDILDPEKPVLSELRRLSDPKMTEEELMSVLGLFMLGQNFFDRPVRELSGGEKARLVLSSLFLARANFLVLDEPTNHLDLESREALVQALESYDGAILLVAHDRWLLGRVAEQVWELSSEGIEQDLGGFEEYERKRRERAAALQEQDSAENAGQRQLSREDIKKAKREQAELRNKLYRELKPKREALTKLETELDKVLTEMDAAEQSLADPEVYADGQRAAKLLKSYQDSKDASETLIERMALLEEEISDLEERQKGFGPE